MNKMYLICEQLNTIVALHLLLEDKYHNHQLLFK